MKFESYVEVNVEVGKTLIAQQHPWNSVESIAKSFNFEDRENGDGEEIKNGHDI